MLIQFTPRLTTESTTAVVTRVALLPQLAAGGGRETQICNVGQRRAAEEIVERVILDQ